MLEEVFKSLENLEKTISKRTFFFLPKRKSVSAGASPAGKNIPITFL